VFSSEAVAHPDDHSFDALSSLSHLLTQPDHLAMLGLAVIVAAGTWFLARRAC
jgi:hypothetical protein